ncbi:MAG: hypothetical protein ABI716_01830 [Candidatus Saccharibacteria bacterium]
MYFTSMTEILTKNTETQINNEHLDALLISEDLKTEINDLRQLGYEIGFSPETERTDRAYDNPAAIKSMHERLRIGGEQYELDHRQSLTRRQLAGAALVSRVHMTPFQVVGTPFRTASRQVRNAREVTRKEILYSPDKMPWHEQAGRAAALLTIAYAHELESEVTDGVYPTMSGLLGDELFDVVFDNRSAGFLRGKTLEQADVIAQENFQGKAPDRAQASTQLRIKKLREFIDQPITEDFKLVVQNSTDSLGIRSRKEKVREVISSYVDKRLENEPELNELTLVSVGCGTALPVFEVAKALKDKGISPKLILLDQDPMALAAAQCLAEKDEFGLGDVIELHCRRLFDKYGKALELSPMIRGRKIDIVEDTGLREYLPPNIYKSLTSTLWRALAPGGIMSTGNMNTNRPQPEFLHGLMGWEPKVRMRDIATGFALHEASGIKKGLTKGYVTPDGVYTLFISQKP